MTGTHGVPEQIFHKSNHKRSSASSGGFTLHFTAHKPSVTMFGAFGVSGCTMWGLNNSHRVTIVLIRNSEIVLVIIQAPGPLY